LRLRHASGCRPVNFMRQGSKQTT